jgi:hypothetical protein
MRIHIRKGYSPRIRVQGGGGGRKSRDTVLLN